MDLIEALIVFGFVASFAAFVAALFYFWPWPPTPFLNREQQEVKILDIVTLSHDTKRFRMSLGGKDAVLGLPVGKYVVITAPNPSSCLSTGKWNGKDDPDRGRKEIARSYTPINGNQTTGYFDLVIKMYRPGKVKMPDGVELTWEDGGKMTQYLDTRSPGDSILMTGPVGVIEYLGKGMFKLPGRTVAVKHVGMIAGGTGITPMLQIMRDALRDKNDHCRFTLIYANKTEDDILLRDMLEQLVIDGKGQFNIVYSLNFPPPKWQHETGFITSAMIRSNFPAPLKKTLDPLILMCGPPLMHTACSKHIELLGYQKQSVISF